MPGLQPCSKRCSPCPRKDSRDQGTALTQQCQRKYRPGTDRAAGSTTAIVLGTTTARGADCSKHALCPKDACNDKTFPG